MGHGAGRARQVRLLVLRASFVADNRGWSGAARVLRGVLAGGRDLTAARASGQQLAALLARAPGAVTVKDWETHCVRLLDAVSEACVAAHAGGDQVPGVVDAVFEALSLVFHPALQQGLGPAPLVDEPEIMLRLLNHSALAGLPGLHWRPAPSEPEPVMIGMAGSADQRPLRLFLVSEAGLAFTGALEDHWRQRADLELRVRDLRAEGTLATAGGGSARELVRDCLTSRARALPEGLAADLAWADVVWCEWGTVLAARLAAARLRARLQMGPDSSRLKARLIVRLHKFEAFTMIPAVTSWAGVDALDLIATPVRSVLERSAPALAHAEVPGTLREGLTALAPESGAGSQVKRTGFRQTGITGVVEIPNAVDLSRFVLPKRPEAARTLALVGYNRLVKDPAWALDVLDALLVEDPAWRLMLVGAPGPVAGASAAEADYFGALEQRIGGMGDRVLRLGHRADMPQVLTGAGVIVSASRVEGVHIAVQEGAASGALPVVRDWPGLVPVGGARAVYPDSWVVTTPQQAAARILAATQLGHGDPAASQYARQAQEWALTHLDAPAVLPRIDALVGLGPTGKVPAQQEEHA